MRPPADWSEVAFGLPLYATKAELAELRGEVKSLKWVLGIGAAWLTVVVTIAAFVVKLP